MAWSRETVANSSRLFFGSDASASSTPQNRVIVCAASFASCSAGDRDVEDGVGVGVVLVTEVVVEGVLGSFVVQADVTVIATRASVATIRLLAFVMSGTPCDLTSPKGRLRCLGGQLEPNRCTSTSAFASDPMGSSTRPCRQAWGSPGPFPLRFPGCVRSSDGVPPHPVDTIGPHLGLKCPI